MYALAQLKAAPRQAGARFTPFNAPYPWATGRETRPGSSAEADVLRFILGPPCSHLNRVGHRIVAGAIVARPGQRASRAETS